MHVTNYRQVLYLTLVVVLGLCLTQCVQSSRPVEQKWLGLFEQAIDTR